MLNSLALAVSVASAPSARVAAYPTSSQTSRRIDRLAKAEIAAGRTPGLAIAVIENGRLIYARGFGYANRAKGIHASETTPFAVGSITKQFTAAALLLLQQNGKLGLEDRVTKYVPELTIANNVTIRELLQQTSGLPDYTKAPGILANPTRRVALPALIAAVNTMPLESSPGKQFHYNNFNYFIAGLIVERASGQSYTRYVHENILQPLGLHATWYAGQDALPANRAIGYTGKPRHFLRAAPWDPSWLLGAGGIVSTAYDLAYWDAALPSLLNRNNLSSMFAPSNAPGPQSYAMGWIIDQRNGETYIWHNGELGGFHSMNAVLPDQDIAVVVLTNVDDLFGPGVTSPERLAGQILDILAPLAPVSFDPSVTALAEEWLGRLASRDINRAQLTPAFSTYLNDAMLAQVNVASFGRLRALKPLASSPLPQGGTKYEFMAQFDRATLDYTISLTRDGLIDGLLLTP